MKSNHLRKIDGRFLSSYYDIQNIRIWFQISCKHMRLLQRWSAKFLTLLVVKLEYSGKIRSIGSASLARSIRIRFHFRHRTGRIRSVSDHRAGRVWRSRHRSKTPNCLPGARDQVPALFRNAIERRGASVDSNSGAPITQSTFNMLRRMANLLSLLNWWLHRYDNEDDYALFQV